METGMNFTYQELLAEIGAKSLIIQRQNLQIAELQAALQAKRGEVPEDALGATEPTPLAIAGNGAKSKT